MSPVIAFDIAIVAQKVKVQCCYIMAEMLNLKKLGGCWVSNRSGWLLELLTELTMAIYQPEIIFLLMDPSSSSDKKGPKWWSSHQWTNGEKAAGLIVVGRRAVIGGNQSLA